MVGQFKGFSKSEIDSLVEGEASWNRITLQLKMQLLPVLTNIALLMTDINRLLDVQLICAKYTIGIYENAEINPIVYGYPMKVYKTCLFL